MEKMIIRKGEVEDYLNLVNMFISSSANIVGKQTFVYALSRNKKTFAAKSEKNRKKYFEIYNELVGEVKDKPKDFNPLSIREKFQKEYDKLVEKYKDSKETSEDGSPILTAKYKELEASYVDSNPIEMNILKVLMERFDRYLQETTSVNIYKVIDVEKLPEDFGFDNFEQLSFMIGEEVSDV